jgi:hypothetical protein
VRSNWEGAGPSLLEIRCFRTLNRSLGHFLRDPGASVSVHVTDDAGNLVKYDEASSTQQ